jgi:hypothetical protein
MHKRNCLLHGLSGKRGKLVKGEVVTKSKGEGGDDDDAIDDQASLPLSENEHVKNGE